MEKTVLRMNIKNILMNINKDRTDIYTKLFNHPKWLDAKVVCLYKSIPKFEINTQPIIDNALSAGKKIYYPVVINKEDMSMKGLDEYKGCDLILVPGLLFGINNKGRIGYGRGYYDRWLNKNHKNEYLLSIALKEQVIPEVPMDKTDYKLDEILVG